MVKFYIRNNDHKISYGALIVNTKQKKEKKMEKK